MRDGDEAPPPLRVDAALDLGFRATPRTVADWGRDLDDGRACFLVVDFGRDDAGRSTSFAYGGPVDGCDGEGDRDGDRVGDWDGDWDGRRPAPWPPLCPGRRVRL